MLKVKIKKEATEESYTFVHTITLFGLCIYKYNMTSNFLCDINFAYDRCRDNSSNGIGFTKLNK